MENTSLILIAAVLAAVLIALLVSVLLNGRETRRMLGRMRQTADRQGRDIVRLGQAFVGASGQLAELSERQDRLRDSMDMRLDALSQTNDQQLGEMRDIVTGKLDSRLTDSFGAVNKQLNEVHKGLGEMHRMAGEFADLKRVLGGVKTRGIWGEAQLGAILAEMLAPSQYIANAAIPAGSQTRVEFAVRLPARDGEALLPIDSKFPQEDFLRLMDAVESGDPMQIEAHARQLERALTEQARLISDKYIRPPETADFAIMFLPVESLYAEAVRIDGLCEQLQSKYRVLVAGPGTLAALLSSLAMGFRTIQLEKRSGEMLARLTEVQREFARYGEALGTLRKRLSQAEEALTLLESRARAMERELRMDEREES